MSTSRAPYGRGVPHGLMFHRFRTSERPSGSDGALTPEDIEAILHFVGPENILTPSEWMARLETGRLAASDLCITFDDGLRSQFECALPVLDKYGLKAFWFVYTCVLHGEPVRSEIYSHVAGLTGGMAPLTAALLDRCPPTMRAQLSSEAFSQYTTAIYQVAPFYSDADVAFRFLRNRPENRDAFEALMDTIVEELGFDLAAMTRTLWLGANELHELSLKGHHVGLHSYDHPYDMAMLTREQQREQYERNAADISAATRQMPTSMAHPLSAYDQQTLELLDGMGIRCGFRANMTCGGGTAAGGGPLELSREDSAILLSMAAEARG